MSLLSLPAPAAPLLSAQRRIRLGALLLAGMAGLCTAVALYLRLRIFNQGSANNDEGVYLLQAHALRHGHLVLPFDGDVEARQPWLYAIGPHGYIAKYLPVVAGLYAVGLTLFSSVTPVLLALAAAVPVLTHRLALDLGLSRHRALLAGALVGLSPAILTEGGLVLSYLPFLVTGLGCWIVVFRSADRRGGSAAGWAAAAVLLAALAACMRPMDGIVLLAPSLLWLLWRCADRVWAIVGGVAGGLPVLVGVLLYNRRVTGSALRLPFSLLDPHDSFGFGEHRFFPEDKLHHYGPLQALAGTSRHFFIEPAQWMWGFLPVLGLALWAVRPRGSASERHRVLVASAGALLVAYVFFWGPWHASYIWGWTRTVGPFYSLPMFAPLVLAALTVPISVRTLSVLLLAGSIHPAVHGVDAVGRMHRNHRETAEVLALLDPRVTTLFDVDAPYLGHPVSELAGPHIWLSSQAPVSRLPAGPWHMLALASYPYRPVGHLNYQLREMVLTRAAQPQLTVRRAGKRYVSELLLVTRGGVASACVQGPTGATLTLTATGVSGCSGAALPTRWTARPYRICPDLSCLSIMTFTPDKHGHWHPGVWRQLPVEVVDGQLRLLTDGRALHSSGKGWISVVAH
ncbi:MAG TPA: hypothetical protein VGJ14_05475 [Sporichthyaceae bacterium]